MRGQGRLTTGAPVVVAVQPRRTSPLPAMLTLGTAAPVCFTRLELAIEMRKALVRLNLGRAAARDISVRDPAAPSASSTTVTACSMPGGIQSARDGGTMVVPCGIVTRTTPALEIAICPQGVGMRHDARGREQVLELGAYRSRLVRAKQMRRQRAESAGVSSLAGSR